MEARLMRLVCAVATAVVLSGCDVTEPEPCRDVTDPCESEGVQRCNDGETGIEVCADVGEGCLGWTEETTCSGEARCSNAGADVVCRCTGEGVCDEEGETACRGSMLRRCAPVDGCLRYEDDRDCSDDGLVCRSTAEGAQCAPGCAAGECAPGERRCDADAIEVCDVGPLGCLEWLVELDCTVRDEVCDDSADMPFCHPRCAAVCEVLGSMRCDATVVQRCEEVAGCLSWVNLEDCSRDRRTCGESDGEVQCVCAGICVDGERRCHGTEVDRCILRSDGCWAWQAFFDCHEVTSWVCDDTGASQPACVGGTGADCEHPMAAFSLPFVLSGADFRADSGDGVFLVNPSCTSFDGSEDTVVAVYVATGQTLVVASSGEPLALSVQERGCGDLLACAAAGASGETVRYTATADDVVWVVVELDPAAATPAPYEVLFALAAPEACDDDLDNDLDDLVDCDDPDCFGDPAACAVETACEDGYDNDLDGFADCDDETDCGGLPECTDVVGYWEGFDGATDPFDLEGHSLVFTPDAGDPNGYAVTVLSGLTALPETAGGGTVSTDLSVGPDDVRMFVPAVMASVPFYGTSYSSVHVGSGGYVTFGSGSPDDDTDPSVHFALPGVSLLRGDLDPSAGGLVVVDDYADRLVVTYSGVPHEGEVTGNDVQLVLGSDGTIGLHYLAVPSSGDHLVGLSRGVGTLPIGETDFVP